MNDKRTLKMYVWLNVLNSYGSGMATVLAHDEDEARKLIKDTLPVYTPKEEFDEKPLEITEPKAFYIYGSD